MAVKTFIFSVVLAIVVTACAPAPKPGQEPIIEKPIVTTPIVATLIAPSATVVPAVRIKQNDLIFLEFFAIT